MTIVVIIVAALVAAPVAAIALVTIFDLLARPTFRRLALRNMLRRKNEALLVVLGSMLGTAIVTSSFVVGDTLHASIRDEARTRLGPIDEIVLVHRATDLPTVVQRVAARPVPATDGTLSLVTASAAVATAPDPRGDRLAEPEGFVEEVDFDAARQFGERPADTGLADAGPTPTADEAVIGDDLADALHAHAGDRVEVFAFGKSRAFTIRGVVPRLGVAGFHPGFADHSENVFVAPGTLAAMAAGAPGGAQAPEGRLLVSNTGGVSDGVAASASVARALEVTVAGVPAVEVTQDKQGTLDFADRQGNAFTRLFGLIGGFAVLAGVLLLVNIFVMLSQERTSELGLLRAIGLKRNHLVRTFGLEGNLYALTAAGVGAAAGVGVGRVVVSATERIFAENDATTKLQFSVRPSSLAIAFAIGLVISVVTVWATSLRIGRLNVIRALRDTPPPPRPVPARPSRTAAAGVLLGCVLFALSVATSEPVLALVGPALVAWSAVPLLTPTVGQRAAVTGPCLLLVIYGVTAFAVLPSVFRAADIPVFFVQGVLLVFSAVAVVVRNDDQFHRVSERLSASGRGLALRLGLANPLAKRFRTALLLGMYALIMFVLVFMAVFAAVFRAQAPTLTEQTRAGYDLRVDSNPGNPVTANQLEADADVLAAAPILLADAQFQIDPTADAQSQRLGGFDSSLLDRGAPHLTLRDARFATDEAAWRAVLASPDLAIVPGGFLSSGGGPPRRTIDLGTRLTLIDPASGRRHPITVVGIDGDLDPAENGAMVAASAIPTFVDRSSASRFYVAVRPGADAESVGQRLQGDLLANGVKADTFRALVDNRLRGTTAFIRLLEGFLALGLVIGIAGLGVVMVRAVRERRREIGMLRAMGFAALVVRRAFLIEAAFIAVQGIVVGALLGIVTGFSVLSNSSTFGDQHLAFTVPWLPILGLAAVALFASLLAVLVPARQASRIKPAVALRIAD